MRLPDWRVLVVLGGIGAAVAGPSAEVRRRLPDFVRGGITRYRRPLRGRHRDASLNRPFRQAVWR